MTPQPVRPPRTQHLVKSPTMGSFNLPPPSAEPVHHVPTPVLVGRGQSAAEVRPPSIPRSISQPEALCYRVHPLRSSSVATSQHNAYPADYKTPRPVRRPPSPPKKKPVTPSRPTTAANGNHDPTNTELSVKSPAVNGERRSSPVPPTRPERPQTPSIYYGSSETEYERTLPDAGPKPQAPDNAKPAGPARPPRPGELPSLSLSSSPSRYENSPLQAREPLTQGNDDNSPVYEDRRVPSIPPKTRNYQRLSMSSCSSSTSSTRQPHYDVLRTEPFSAKENSAPARPQHPPPPSFTPPPPPPPPPSTKRSSLSHPHMGEPLYTEIDDRSYLEVLPEDNDDRIFRPSESVYNSEYHYKTPRRSTCVHTLPHAGLRYSPLHQHQPTIDYTEDVDNLLAWLRTVRYSDNMAPSLYGLSIENETRKFNQRAMCVKKALHLFNLLLIKRNDVLRGHISELTTISNSLEKAQKKSKTMGIAGGTTGAVGGVATVMGLALAPVTMGVSLIATAIGAGMVATAGGMGAHAAIANKKSVDRKRVEKIVQDYKASIVDLEHCLVFIHSGMDELRRHDLARLQRAGAHPEALRMAELSQSVFREDNVLRKSVAPAGGMTSERLLQTFAKDMDLYFTEKDGQKMKKSNESKFLSRVCLLAQSLQEALDELNHTCEMFRRL